MRFSGNQKTVIDGPFSETKELVAGFWVWKVQSMDEAVEWVKRIPNPDNDPGPCDVEIRPIFESEDFGKGLTPELEARAQPLRDRLSAKQK